jgi:Cu+-exporting ATPase
MLVNIQFTVTKMTFTSVPAVSNAIQDKCFNILVDWENDLVTVDYNGNSTRVVDIIASIQNCGFECSIVRSDAYSQSLFVNIKGMTCMSCVNSIKSQLDTVGILFVDVDLVGNCGNIVFDVRVQSRDNIVELINDCGFECSVGSARELELLKVGIRGMTCMSCVNSIKSSLHSIDGVDTVEIDLAGAWGEITFDQSLISSFHVIKCIEECGFDCELYSSTRAGNYSESRDNARDSKVEMVERFIENDKKVALDIQGGIEMKPLLKKENVQIAHLRALGMTCASCVSSIEKHLNSQPGIYKCAVSLALQEATVEYDSGLYIPDDLAAMINDIGFESSVIEETIGVFELQIYGMTCASCSGKIERHFKTMVGVESVSVNLLGQTGYFKVNPKIVGLRDLIESIESLGFSAHVAEKGGNAQLEALARTKEIQKYRKSFWSAFWFTLPIATISMILPAFAPSLVHAKVFVEGLTLGDVSMMLLTFPVQFHIGWHFYVQSFKAVKHGSYTMDVLVCLGTTLSFGYSILSMMNSVSRGGQPLPQVFFETSAMLITFVTLGRYLENLAKSKTSSALSKLIKLAPSHALLLQVSKETGEMVSKEIPAEYIKMNDLLKILPGERFPCDGVIEFGETCVDESVVTGEPLPIEKAVGDAVIAGTVNGNGAVHVRASKVGSDTTLSQIVKLVSEAQASKAPIQAVADKIAGIFVPVVVFLAAITFSFWMIVIETTGYIPSSFPEDSNHFFVCLSLCISVIVVACPCALGLATPTAIMVGTGVGAKLGILIKGGEPLQKAHKITKIV